LERYGPEYGRGDHHGVEGERIVWARLYMEPVEENGQDIDEAMRTITGQDRREEDQSPA
jgi:hypothetical protein